MTNMRPFLLAILCGTLGAPAGAVAQTPPPLHVLKISSGPSGAETNGTFLLTEERSKFSRTADREVIVFFHWDGVPGPHKLEARWRSPDGGFTSNSVIEYMAAERRFGAYWRIAITPNMQLGTWSIEATVDGQPGGRLTFDVTDAAAMTGTAKVNFRKSDLVLSSVKIPVPQGSGIYRAEIHLDGKPAWRGFVRITP